MREDEIIRGLEVINNTLKAGLSLVNEVEIKNDSGLSLPIDDGGGSITVDGAFFPATQPVSAASLPLPSGAATSAKQDTTNTKLDTLIANSAAPVYANSFRVDLSTYNHSKAFKLLDIRLTRTQYVVLNHGSIGSFHLFHTTVPITQAIPSGNVPPLDGVFMSPRELFYHDTWIEDGVKVYNGEVWAMWHEPEEKITTPVAVTLTAGSDLVTRTAHGLTDHAEVLFNTIVTTTGIVIDTIYYAIYISANTFKLALTKANVRGYAANNALAIDLLTGDGSGTITHSLPFTGFLQVTESYT